jgi:hypothetical protein
MILFAALPSYQDIKLGGPSLLLYGGIGVLGWTLGSTVWRSGFH